MPNNVIQKVYNGWNEYLVGWGSTEWAEVVYLTQAEYDALPASKLTDGKIYKVKTTGVPWSVLTAGAGIDITSNTISADMSTAVYDNTTSGATATNMQDAMDEVFQSVSNGKTLIAAAITDKGVSTAATDSFQTMASNISSLDTWWMWKVISVQNPSLPRWTKIFSQVTYTKNYSSYSFSDYENYLENANIYFFQVHREYNDSYYLWWTVMVVWSDWSIQTQSWERWKDWNSWAVFYTLPSDSNTLYIGSVKTGSSWWIREQYYAIARYNLTTNVLSDWWNERITYYNNGTRTNWEPVTFSWWTTKTVDITLTPENFSSNYSISEYHITNYYAN